jgi:hypothetical protein
VQDGRLISRPGRSVEAQKLPDLEDQLQKLIVDAAHELKHAASEVTAAGGCEFVTQCLRYDSLHLNNYWSAGVTSKGEFRQRPWCPATRVLEHREAEAITAAADEAKRAGRLTGGQSATRQRRTGFDSIDVRCVVYGLHNDRRNMVAVRWVACRSMMTPGRSTRANGPLLSQRVQTAVK